MRELTTNESALTSGAIAPAIYGAFMAYNYIRIAYTTTQIVGAAGAASGAAVTVAAAMD